MSRWYINCDAESLAGDSAGNFSCFIADVSQHGFVRGVPSIARTLSSQLMSHCVGVVRCVDSALSGIGAESPTGDSAGN